MLWPMSKNIACIHVLSRTFQHISMVYKFGDTKMLKGSDGLFHCPLCTDLLFRPTTDLQRVEKHFLAQHWHKKIEVKGQNMTNNYLHCLIDITAFFPKPGISMTFFFRKERKCSKFTYCFFYQKHITFTKKSIFTYSKDWKVNVSFRWHYLY